jgi:hypothetical protein
MGILTGPVRRLADNREGNRGKPNRIMPGPPTKESIMINQLDLVDEGAIVR